MRKLVFVVLVVFTLALTAGAQTNISGKAECAKPDPNYSMEVGDRPSHALALTKVACTWPTPMEIEGIRTKEGVSFDSSEINGTRVTDHGYHTTTLASGDKFTVRFQGTATMNKDGSFQSLEGKWSFLSGTGKLRGIRGSGTYKGTGSPDGGVSYDVEGEYQLLAANPAKPAKKSQ